MAKSKLDALVEDIERLKLKNKHITPTVNDIYDVFLDHFDALRFYERDGYECMRERIIRFNKLVLEKKMTLKEAVLNALKAIAEECKPI